MHNGRRKERIERSFYSPVSSFRTLDADEQNTESLETEARTYTSLLCMMHDLERAGIHLHTPEFVLRKQRKHSPGRFCQIVDTRAPVHNYVETNSRTVELMLVYSLGNIR